jgi:hypothetical protein
VYVINPFKNEWAVIEETSEFDHLQWNRSACLSPTEAPWIKINVPAILASEEEDDLLYDEFKTWYNAQE